MRHVFLVGEQRLASPAELSHCGSDHRTEPVPIVDCIFLDIYGEITQAIFGLEIEKVDEKNQDRE